jgi:signal transduction histidine kinase
MTVTTETPRQLKRHRLEEELAAHAARLARNNRALEDFAALVAHDVRSSLLAALRYDEPREGLERSLELVESILDAVRADGAHEETGSVAACARQAIDDLGADGTTLVVEPGARFPVPSAALRVALRNLFANAVAAGANRIDVSTRLTADSRMLIVQDNGSGLDSNGWYVAGAGLGLWLCRRLLARFDASLEIQPAPAGGTRLMIVAQPGGP